MKEFGYSQVTFLCAFTLQPGFSNEEFPLCYFPTPIFKSSMSRFLASENSLLFLPFQDYF